MPANQIRIAARLLLSAALLAASLGGCETTSIAPADSLLGGNWQLDRTASDDPDATIAKAINAAETRLRHRLAHYGYGPDQGAPQGSGSGPETPPDEPDYRYDTPGDRYGGPGLVGPDFRGLRARLQQALVQPGILHLDIQSDLVSIGADQLPPRDYRLGERLSRFDEYGTAVITAKFSNAQFVLKSNYTSHAQRIDSYEVDRASGTLTVTQQISDPIVGRLVLHSLYRRMQDRMQGRS
jgi:hypothetical protein